MGLLNWLFGSSSEPTIKTNCDGTPMLNDAVDIQGRPLGHCDDSLGNDDILSNNWMSDDLDTSSSFDDCSSNDSFSSFDDF